MTPFFFCCAGARPPLHALSRSRRRARDPPEMLRNKVKEPLCCCELGWTIEQIACCPFTDWSHLIAVTGENTALLRLSETDSSSFVLKPAAKHLSAFEGAAHTLAWGRDGDVLKLAAIHEGSIRVLQFLGDVPKGSISTSLPAEFMGADVYDSCYLPQSDLLAVTGETCRCDLLRITGDAMASHLEVERSIHLRSEGVSVRVHAEQPDHLMVAEAGGTVHFVDLRAPNRHCPAISRTLPSAACGKTGLRDADWCPADPHLVGAVAGSQWFGWDLRHGGSGGLDALAHVGEPEAHGTLAFRWAPRTPHFAIMTKGPEASIHTLSTGAGRDERGTWIVETARTQTVTHCLQTRISSMSWLHHDTGLDGENLLAGSGDSKICIWSV